MATVHTELWAGTEDSFKVMAEVEAKIEARSEIPGEAPKTPDLLQVINGVGVINIRGPISNVDSPWNAIFGATSYPAISEALVSAAKNPEVKHILLAIDSPGGSVSGVVDAGDLISTINARVKPVTAFAEGGALSAAYWLASSAGKVYASKTSSVGSIGVIAAHMERSAQLKADGINVTVLRAGKYKALASPHEPLSDAARAQMQELLDAAYAVFASHVAEKRKMSMPAFESTAGQGRVFFGANAEHVGLIDGVKGFSELLGDVSRQSLDKSKYNGQNFTKLEGVNPMSVNTSLTEQDIAAIAAGASVSATGAATEAAVETAADTAVAAAAELEATVEDTAKIDAIAEKDATVALLQGQLAAQNSAMIDALVEAKSLRNQVETLTASQAPLLAIVGKSLGNMQVALGAAPISIDGRAVSDVLAEHARLSESFSSKFKAGGVAATDAVESVTAAAPQSNSLHKARIAATQPNRKGA